MTLPHSFISKQNITFLNYIVTATTKSGISYQSFVPEFTIKLNSQIFHDLLLSQPNSKHLISRFITACMVPVNAMSCQGGLGR